jgi:hypothetical protein
MAEQPVEEKYVEFKPYEIHIRNVEFAGNPPSLAVFPEWVWYTPAPACMWGGLDHDILSGLQLELGVEYYQAIFGTQIFAGFENKEGDYWNRTLWAIKQHDWGKFKEELLKVTSVDVDKELLVKYGLQEVEVYDPIAVQNSTVVTPKTPTLTVFGVGVMTNKHTIAFNPAQSIQERPRVYTQKPDPIMVALSVKILKDSKSLEDVAREFRNVQIEGSDSRYSE